MAAPILTPQRLKELLHYDPVSGLFRWKERPKNKSWNNRYAGREAGAVRDGGYIQIHIDGRFYRAHRLAWLYTHNEWPQHQIDHTNGIRHDNSIRNLRDVTGEINSQNQRGPRTDSSTSLLGVTKIAGSGRYMAQIRAKGGKMYLGMFSCPEKAHQAYVAAKRKYHPGSTL